MGASAQEEVQLETGILRISVSRCPTPRFDLNETCSGRPLASSKSLRGCQISGPARTRGRWTIKRPISRAAAYARFPKVESFGRAEPRVAILPPTSALRRNPEM